MSDRRPPSSCKGRVLRGHLREAAEAGGAVRAGFRAGPPRPTREGRARDLEKTNNIFAKTKVPPIPPNPAHIPAPHPTPPLVHTHTKFFFGGCTASIFRNEDQSVIDDDDTQKFPLKTEQVPHTHSPGRVDSRATILGCIDADSSDQRQSFRVSCRSRSLGGLTSTSHVLFFGALANKRKRGTRGRSARRERALARAKHSFKHGSMLILFSVFRTFLAWFFRAEHHS